METFIEPRELINNPGFEMQKQQILAGLTDRMIDGPIVNVIRRLNKIPCCFTLQCCYGHFTYDGHWDPHNLDPLPASEEIGRVEYRIAYIAFCIDNCVEGRDLMDQLEKLTAIDPENLQYGSARWFWKRQVNSFALQVEPERFKHKDKVILEYKEAFYIEKLRTAFFHRLEELLQ